MNTPIDDLFAAYVRATGMVVARNYARETACLELHRRGITPADIDAVVSDIRAGIAKGVRNWGALKFHNLMDADMLEEELALLRARQRAARAPRFTPDKASVLRATGRPDAPEVPTGLTFKDLAQAIKNEVKKS